MPKKRATSRELAQMILRECEGMDIHRLDVAADGANGYWYPIVIAHPSVVAEYTAHINQVADRLRGEYDLIEEHEFKISGFHFIVSGDLLRRYAAARGDMRGGLRDLAETYKAELAAAAARAINAGVQSQPIEIRQIE